VVAEATVPAVTADTVKLTYQQGQAAGTSTPSAAAPALLLGPFQRQAASRQHNVGKKLTVIRPDEDPERMGPGSSRMICVPQGKYG
jgi:hypothetical protein